MGSHFADGRSCNISRMRTIVPLHLCTNDRGSDFAVHESTVKTAKFGSLENLPLYGSFTAHARTGKGRSVYTLEARVCFATCHTVRAGYVLYRALVSRR